MRNKNYQSVFFLIGIFLHAIYLYGGMKIFWFIGCVFIIISPFLPGGFLQIDFKKSPKKQDKKENSIQGMKNSTSSTEKNSEQDNFPPS